MLAVEKFGFGRGDFFGLALDSHAQTEVIQNVLRPCCQVEKAAAPVSDRSVYQLNSNWTNDANRVVKLSELRGRPQVVANSFASCQGACPLLLEQMRQAAIGLPGAGTNFGYLLVTFDPERDTPQVLHTYRNTHDLSQSAWALLRGSPEDVRELALVLGVKYRREQKRPILTLECPDVVER